MLVVGGTQGGGNKGEMGKKESREGMEITVQGIGDTGIPPVSRGLIGFRQCTHFPACMAFLFYHKLHKHVGSRLALCQIGFNCDAVIRKILYNCLSQANLQDCSRQSISSLRSVQIFIHGSLPTLERDAEAPILRYTMISTMVVEHRHIDAIRSS
jgi:hypothetical protein